MICVQRQAVLTSECGDYQYRVQQNPDAPDFGIMVEYKESDGKYRYGNWEQVLCCTNAEAKQLAHLFLELVEKNGAKV